MPEDFQLVELQHKIKHLSGLIEDPRVDEARKGLYRTGMAEFQRQYDALKNAQKKSDVPPETPPTLPQPKPAPVPPPSPEGGSAFNKFRPEGEQGPPLAPQPQQGQSAPLPREQSERSAAPEFAPSAPVMEPNTDRAEAEKVLWGNLTARLRELVNSWAAGKGLFHLLPIQNKATFEKAVAAYVALCQYWGRDVQMVEVVKDRMGPATRAVWERVWGEIIEHAKKQTA